MANIIITAEDLERGFVIAPLLYRGAKAPAKWPEAVRLDLPGYRVVDGLLEDFERRKDPYVFLLACLPKPMRNDDFLDRLSLDCLRELLRGAYVLCLGEELACRIFGACPAPPQCAAA